jgi:hypothetical protein
MVKILKHRGYQLHAPDSPEAEALLVEHCVTRADLVRALAEMERTHGIAIRTIAGINDDGVFGTRRESWRPDLPDACVKPFIPLLWLQVLELLGRAPLGSTARFLIDGTLPDCKLAGWGEVAHERTRNVTTPRLDPLTSCEPVPAAGKQGGCEAMHLGRRKASHSTS